MANGCINNLQMEHGMDSFGTEFATASRKPASCRAAPGAGGLRHHRRRLRLQNLGVTTLDELRHALDAAVAKRSAPLIDIKVLPRPWCTNTAAGGTSGRPDGAL